MNELDLLNQHISNAYRVNSETVNLLTKRFGVLSAELIRDLRVHLDNLSDAELKALQSGKYTTPQLKELKQDIDHWYSQLKEELPALFMEATLPYAAYEAAFMARLYAEEVDVKAESILREAKKKPIAGGMLYDEIFDNLALKTRNQTMHVLRNGIASGWTTKQITNEIKVLQESTQRNIEADVRTMRNHVANTAYEETFKALGFKYVRFLSTLDGRTSKVCAANSDKVFKIDEPHPTPPLHYRCRSVLVGVETKDGHIDGKRPFVADDRPVSKIPKGQREGKIGQVDANTKYPEWFAKQDAKFQKDWLGQTRYELYKKGGLSLDKFVDPLTGKQYTLAELKRKDDELFKRLGL